MKELTPFEQAIRDGLVAGFSGKSLPEHYQIIQAKKINTSIKDEEKQKPVNITFDQSEKVFVATIGGSTHKCTRRRDIIRFLKSKGFSLFNYDPTIPGGDRCVRETSST